MAEALSALTIALRSLIVFEPKWATPVHLDFAVTSSPVVVPLARSTRPSDEVQALCQIDVDNSASFSSITSENQAPPLDNLFDEDKSWLEDARTQQIQKAALSSRDILFFRALPADLTDNLMSNL